MLIKDVNVTVTGLKDISQKEIESYISYVKAQEPTGGQLQHLTISSSEDGKIQLDYDLQAPKFERIRRITGYLVGSIDRWNDAKRSEERERVKHDISC